MYGNRSSILPWGNATQSRRELTTTHETPPEGGKWFLESLFHPSVPSCLPDGSNEFFILKPIKSSFNFATPEGGNGNGTLVLYPLNSLGRLAEWWFQDPDDESGTGYGPCQVFNVSQPLPKNFDYARGVKAVTLVESASLPSGKYVLNGRAMAVQFPYPAGEKPSIDDTNVPASKYSYEALVGTQSDQNAIVAGVKMDDGIVLLSVGKFGERPLRLGDNVITSNSSTKVQANDVRQSLGYSVEATPATDVSFTVSGEPTFFRTGKVLCTAAGGMNATMSYRGSFTPNVTPGEYDLRVGFFCETYDMMGRVIDLQQIPVELEFTQLTGSINFSRSVNFALPAAGELLAKPIINQIQFGIWAETINGSDFAATNFDLQIIGTVNAIAGDAWEIGKPSQIWAVSGAVGQQFNVASTAWFEATPNSDLLQTTQTITYPQGNSKAIEDYWEGVKTLSKTGDFAFVWTKSDWNKVQSGFHPVQMLQWAEIAPEMIEVMNQGDEGGDMSTLGRWLNKVGHEITKAGSKGAKKLEKVAKKALKDVAPEALEYALQNLGDVAGLSDHQKDIARRFLQKAGAPTIENKKIMGGRMAGGSLAGGSLATRRPPGYCATSQTRQDFEGPFLVPRMITAGIDRGVNIQPVSEPKIGDFQGPLGNARSEGEAFREPESVDWRREWCDCSMCLGARSEYNEVGSGIRDVPVETITSTRKWGFCATGKTVFKNPPQDVPSSEKIKRVLSWKQSKGCFVPALFFNKDAKGEASFTSSGLYYLVADPVMYKAYLETQAWTRDKKGQALVGHLDPNGLEVLLPKCAVLFSVDNAESTKDGDIQITVGFDRPATGRSVEAACVALKYLQDKGELFRTPIGITGDMLAPSNGAGWRLATMPADYGYWKKRALHSLVKGLKLPVLGNWSGADIPVTTAAELKKAMHAHVATKVGMCATGDPIRLWKDGLNPNFNLDVWLVYLLASVMNPGYIVSTPEGEEWTSHSIHGPDRAPIGHCMSGKGETVSTKKRGGPKESDAGPGKMAKPKPAAKRAPKTPAQTSKQVQTKPQVATKADLEKLSKRIDRTLLDLSKELQLVVKRLPKDSGEIILPQVKIASLANKLLKETEDLTEHEVNALQLIINSVGGKDIRPQDAGNIMSAIRDRIQNREWRDKEITELEGKKFHFKNKEGGDGGFTLDGKGEKLKLLPVNHRSLNRRTRPAKQATDGEK